MQAYIVENDGFMVIFGMCICRSSCHSRVRLTDESEGGLMRTTLVTVVL